MTLSAAFVILSFIGIEKNNPKKTKDKDMKTEYMKITRINGKYWLNAIGDPVNFHDDLKYSTKKAAEEDKKIHEYDMKILAQG